MTFESVLRLPQKLLKRRLYKELSRLGYTPLSSRGFLYAEGSIPVLLVAHLDTVHERSVKTICYSSDKRVVMSPEGIGGDDRAGVYMILKILQTHRCHVLFCEDEEIGGVGASLFVRSGISPNVNYIVELDRRGANDAVFYDCGNFDFTRFICSFGFEEDYGTFSDISVIAPALGVAAVNISAGYYNEHTLHESIDLKAVKNNVERVRKMVDTPAEQFEYIPVSLGLEDYLDVCLLVPIQEGDYIFTDGGEMIEPEDDILMGEDGVAHRLVGDNLAVRLDGCNVYSRESLPAQFHTELADIYDILYI